jgi:DNA-binding MarR family transcriptional regulator
MMPNVVTVDLTETRVLEALFTSGVALDATQVAERASLLPADADAALHRLIRKDFVVRVRAERRDRRSRYVPK